MTYVYACVSIIKVLEENSITICIFIEAITISNLIVSTTKTIQVWWKNQKSLTL